MDISARLSARSGVLAISSGAVLWGIQRLITGQRVTEIDAEKLGKNVELPEDDHPKAPPR